MMRQYRRIKEQHRDTILFFRLGDFYEMFDTDAHLVSGLLNITLTSRNGVPMCGIPYHAASSYIARLLRSGKKIAICEQTAMPEKGKGIASREVIEILTPGTVVDETFLDKNAGNYLISVAKTGDTLSLSWLDLSTAEFVVSSHPFTEREAVLKRELLRLGPKEAIVQDSLFAADPVVARVFSERQDLIVNRYPDWSFGLDSSASTLKRQFGVANLKGFGLEDDDPALFSAGILLDYVGETSKTILAHIREVRLRSDDSFLTIDEATQRNLELVRNLQDGGRRYTLLETLDHTVTSMGARRLRNWILNPLLSVAEIQERQRRVEFLYRSQETLSQLRGALKAVLDIERLSARVAMDKAHAKDLLGIRNSIRSALEIRRILGEKGAYLDTLAVEDWDTLSGLGELLSRSILEDPSILLTEGRMIRAGYDASLDELKELKKNAQTVLGDYLERERERTGISSLKIRYNRIIGYFLEVTKANSQLVPQHFIRRQSLVGGERFTTDDLISIETELNNASERIVELEKRLFLEIRDETKKKTAALLRAAAFIAELDCIAALAQGATVHGYTKPEITSNGILSIRNGRHPVVEAHLPTGEFVSNSLSMDTEGTHFIFITGPNMAGKSTYLRQNALIVIMAQIGSFVPADEAVIGIVDRIFCRVGAQDNVARGESTFLVEMNETAYILRSATRKSFIIMDEVGRGTGTRDGLAIAQAVSECLMDRIGARTLFATHFHELTQLSREGMENHSLQVADDGRDIHFLKHVIPGPASNSYGVHVAKLAGIPEPVIVRAEELLAAAPSLSTEGDAGRKNTGLPVPGGYSGGSLLFPEWELIEREIRSARVDTLTPLKALNRIAEWKARLTGEKP